MTMNRRQFIALAAAATGVAMLPYRLSAQNTLLQPIDLNSAPGKQAGHMPTDFIGLSYESSHLGTPGFFAASNLDLVQYFRLLTPSGVLRIGGNTSEFTNWTPDGVGTGGHVPRSGAKVYRETSITSATIDNLAEFTQATGWKVIYGLNLGTGTLTHAADEAAYVYARLGSRLLAFQIGNEPNIFPHNGLRGLDWGYADFFQEWSIFAAAIKQKTRGAPLAGPDTSHAWLSDFAKEAGNQIVQLTGHYYVEGPNWPADTAMSHLMTSGADHASAIRGNVGTARGAGLSFRMSEGNSGYFHGGRTGVSNAFGAGLWAGDFALQCAAGGYAGVNFHGGGASGPIVGSPMNHFAAGPVFYGLLLAAQFQGAEFLPIAFDPQGANITAYAARQKNKVLLALFNKSALPAQIPVRTRAGNAALWQLTAPDVSSMTGFTLAGSAVTSNGHWAPASAQTLSPQNGIIAIALPAYSAVLASFE